jgi:lambda family phage portal protein
LHRLDQYDVAESTAAIVTACKMGFFVRKPDAAGEYTGEEKDDDGNRVMKAEPGTFEELPEGYDISQFDPQHPGRGLRFFHQAKSAVGWHWVGMAYHTLANDLEGVNFSSARVGELQQRDEFKKLQKHMAVSFVRPHFNEALRYAILSGELKLPISRLEEFQKAAHFHGAGGPMSIRKTGLPADVERIEAGLTSRSRVIAESDRGGDVETVDAEIATDKAIDEKHGSGFQPGRCDYAHCRERRAR